MSDRIRAAGVAAGVVALVGGLVAGVWVFLRSERELERRYALPLTTPSFESEVDAGLIERGRHLVTVVAQCTYCHGPDLGGRAMADDRWIGRLHASNLTRGEGGIAARYSDASWTAALRHGVDPDGRSLLLMPSAGLARLSDRDLAAVVAYVRAVPAVDRILPEKRTGWLTRLVVALGLAPDLISAQQVAARADTARAVTEPGDPAVENGEYLVEVGSCRVCHRADLAGGLHPLSLPGEPVPPDLTPSGAIGGWSLADFARAMREGRTPEGRLLDREFMPWPGYAGLHDDEIEAIWRYLESRGVQGNPRTPEGTDVAGREDDRSKT